MAKITAHKPSFLFYLHTSSTAFPRFPQNLIWLCVELNPMEWESERSMGPPGLAHFHALSPSATLTQRTGWLKSVCWRYWSHTLKGILCLWKSEKKPSIMIGLWNVDSFSLKLLLTYTWILLKTPFWLMPSELWFITLQKKFINYSKFCKLEKLFPLKFGH